MAFYKGFIKLQDAYARRSTRRFDVAAVDQPTALTAMADFTADYAGLSEAEVLSYGITEEVQYTDTVDAGANLDAGITFTVSIVGEESKRASIKVPAPIPGVLNPDGTVDLADAAITAFEANYLGGAIRVSDKETVADFLKGKLDR